MVGRKFFLRDQHFLFMSSIVMNRLLIILCKLSFVISITSKKKKINKLLVFTYFLRKIFAYCIYLLIKNYLKNLLFSSKINRYRNINKNMDCDFNKNKFSSFNF